MGRRPKYTFLQRRHTDGQQTHEKMFRIANYKRNANKNYNENYTPIKKTTIRGHLTPVKMAIIQKSANN